MGVDTTMLIELTNEQASALTATERDVICWLNENEKDTGTFEQ